MCTTATADTQYYDLKGQLQELADSHRFTVQNLEKVAEMPPQLTNGSLPQQINQLLKDYNFVQLARPDGSIERVIITGVKKYELKPEPVLTESAEAAGEFKIKTERLGPHHVINAQLTGPTGKAISIPLLVDTGATTLALPLSQKDALGFTDNDLQASTGETANGKVETLHGMLKSVRVGKALAENIEVNFIEDDKLQNNGLLGMSFLGRFRMTFDDNSNEITLIRN